MDAPGPALLRKLECLASAGIQLLPASEIETHFVLERDGFILLVERTDAGFGQIGSPGLLTPHGFAALTWRGTDPYFVAKDFQQAATPEEVAAARAFSGNVKNCIDG